MIKLTRRGFLIATGATGIARLTPNMVAKPAGRRILTLVYDKALGMMRAVERLVP
jgi:hypothetical protein